MTWAIRLQIAIGIILQGILGEGHDLEQTKPGDHSDGKVISLKPGIQSKMYEYVNASLPQNKRGHSPSPRPNKNPLQVYKQTLQP